MAYQAALDYAGEDFTASATLANPDIVSGSGVLALQYLQSMTKRYCHNFVSSSQSECRDFSVAPEED